MSIKRKLILIMMLISFIPLVLLSAISISYLDKILEKETVTQCQELAKDVKNQINSYLDKPITALKVIVSNNSIKEYDLVQAKPFLVQIQKSYPDISFTLDDANGNQVLRGDSLGLVNIKDRAYFQSALKGNEEAISEPVVSKTNNKLTVNIGVPVRSSETGVIVGVMQGSLPLSKISEFVTNLSDNSSTAYVIDASGKVLAHPNEKMVSEHVDMSEVDFVKKGLSDKNGGFSIIADKDAGQKIVTYEYDKRTGWLICLEIPYTIIAAKTHTLLVTLGLVTFGILVIVGLLVFFITKRFTKPIIKMKEVAGRISQGDLTQTMNSSATDEIGLLAQAFDLMVVNLKKLIKQVQTNAETMAAASEELTASAEQSALAANQVAVSITEVARGADKQLHVVAQTSNVVEQMSVSIQQVATNARLVSEQSVKTAETAREGGKSVERAVKQIRGLEDTVSTSAQVVTHLGERSKEIGQIVDAISGIAGQTNLLALNAAIEAARAGEQGRGFAVVAEEVRKLAEQSQEAAKQIENLVGEIQGETEKSVSAMNEGTREVKVGAEVVNEAGRAFERIIGLVTQLSGQIEEISTSIQQIVDGSQQMVSSVREIHQLSTIATGEAQTVSAATEEQSASMEEIASSSQGLAKMAQDLQQAISKFRS